MPVKKGQALGQSGTTGTWTSHLHVEFQAFDSSGSVTTEDFPAQSLLIDHPSIAAAAQRIRGSMNFACFLPADEAPDIDSNRFSHLPRKLLSVRTSYPFSPPGPPPSSITLDLDVNSLVPVYTTNPGTYDGTVPITHLDRLPHNKIGCYVILREDQIDGYTFYEIEWKDSQRVWVPQKHNLDFLEIPTLMSKEVVAVQIEDASTPPLPARTVVHTEESNIKVRSFPAIARDRFGQPLSEVDPGHNFLGTLSVGDGYDIERTYLDPYGIILNDPAVTRARQRWWQIDFGGQAGWVRSDTVNESGPTGRIALGWPPVRGAAVVVSWEPSAVPLHTPRHLQVTGYRVRRNGEGTGIFSGVDHQATFPWVDPTPDSETGRITFVDVAGASPYALLFYEVSALVGDTEGARTEAYSVIFAPEENGVYVTPQGPQGGGAGIHI